MIDDAAYWIDRLKLMNHPEGGYYREIYRSREQIDKNHLPERYSGPRTFYTSIYFLLEGNDFSALHRLKSDEIWHYYCGSPLTIYSINQQGVLSQIPLGKEFEKGEVFQAAVPAGNWFGARMDHSDSFALVGCSVAPGFDFDDFEMGERGELLKKFPQHKAIIEQLTRL